MLHAYDCGLMVVRTIGAAIVCHTDIAEKRNVTVSRYFEVVERSSHLYSELPICIYHYIKRRYLLEFPARVQERSPVPTLMP